MTIEKAMELLFELHNGMDLDALPDHGYAVRLGIEALKRIDHDRGLSPYSPLKRLPGEEKK